MAGISIHVDGDVEFGRVLSCDDGDPQCFSVLLQSYLKGTERWSDHPITYSRDHLNIHGSVEEIRAFAKGILAHLPAEKPVQVETPDEAETKEEVAV